MPPSLRINQCSFQYLYFVTMQFTIDKCPAVTSYSSTKHHLNRMAHRYQCGNNCTMSTVTGVKMTLLYSLLYVHRTQLPLPTRFRSRLRHSRVPQVTCTFGHDRNRLHYGATMMASLKNLFVCNETSIQCC